MLQAKQFLFSVYVYYIARRQTEAATKLKDVSLKVILLLKYEIRSRNY